MGFSNGTPTIVTDGLVFAVDAGNGQSYVSGSGDCISLVGNNTGSLSDSDGSGMFSSNNQGSWDFDGVDDYIDCGDINELDAVTNFTTMVWFKLDGTGNNDTIFAKTTDANNRIDIIKHSNGILYFQVHNGGNGYLGVNFSDLGWNHVAMVFDGSQGGTIPASPYYQAGLQCYLNGSKITTFNTGAGTIPAITPTLSNNFLIGEYDVSAGYFLEGKISNLQIYNKSLSAAEVTQNYNATKERFI
tara:strand:- start:26160 stop:26891 length:732 start_codon:yes stop_codon:yes gene_type:complete